MQTSADYLKLIKFQENCYRIWQKEQAATGDDNDYTAKLQSQIYDLVTDSCSQQDESQIAAQIASLQARINFKNRLELADSKGHQPYFASFSFMEGGKEKHYFIGESTYRFGDNKFQILNWRSSPLSALFFRYVSGDEFYEELSGKVREGEIIGRYWLTFAQKKLVQVIFEDCLYSLKQGRWQAEPPKKIITCGGQGQATNPEKIVRSIIAAQPLFKSQKFTKFPGLLLNAEQYEVVTKPPELVTVIYGSAGSGKTIVSLHRLICLLQRNPEKYTLDKIAVFVLKKGLAHYISAVLTKFDIAEDKVLVVHGYIAEVFHKTFTKRFEVNFDSLAPVAVTRVKKSSALKIELDKFLQQKIYHWQQQLLAITKKFPNLKELINNIRQLTLVKGILKLHHTVNDKNASHISTLARQDIKNYLAHWIDPELEFITETSIFFSLWNIFWGDFQVLAAVVDKVSSQGEISDSDVVLEWLKKSYTAYQTSIIDKFLMADYYSSAEPIAESDLDDNASAIAPAVNPIDEDDATIILYMYQKLIGKLKFRGRKLALDCIMIDEVQDLSLMEIDLLSSIVRSPGTIILSGDLNQKIFQQSGFEHWDEVKVLFENQNLSLSQLAVSYRTTEQIMKFALDILGEYKFSQTVITNKQGPPVRLCSFKTSGEMYFSLAESLKKLQQLGKSYSVGILCLSDSIAKRIHEHLVYLEVDSLRLVLDEAFSFESGVDITTIFDAKGLEFDYVFVFDVDAKHFPDSRYMRYLLHTAATRACFELYIYCQSVFSPIIPQEYQKKVAF